MPPNMKYFTFNHPFTYEETYLPTPRHRILRYRKVKGSIKLKIRSISADEAPVAFRCSDYSHRCNHQEEIRAYKGRLYMKDWRHLTNEEREAGEEGYRTVTIDELPRYFRSHCYISDNIDKDTVVKELKKEAHKWLVVDGIPYHLCGEPMYVVNTFGLGHNHGGTAMFVQHHYNNNIPNKNYFNALDGDRAVAYANKVAEARGDTNDVDRFGKMIEVLIPEMVRRRPMKEHGEGDSFINALNAITESSDSAAEAGILAIALTAAEINK